MVGEAAEELHYDALWIRIQSQCWRGVVWCGGGWLEYSG